MPCTSFFASSPVPKCNYVRCHLFLSPFFWWPALSLVKLFGKPRLLRRTLCVSFVPSHTSLNDSTVDPDSLSSRHTEIAHVQARVLCPSALINNTIQENGMGCAFLYDESRADLLSQIFYHPSSSQNDSASHKRRALGSICGRLRDRSLFGTDRPSGAPGKPCQGHFKAVALRLRNIAPGLSLPIGCI